MFFRSHSANWLIDLANTVWLNADVMIHQQLYELPRGAAVAGSLAVSSSHAAAYGRGQGTETLAELGGLPPSIACVSQRLDA
jgi:hypothetical protein